MTVDQLVSKFLTDVKYRNMSSKNLSHRLKIPLKIVEKAREEYRRQYKANNKAVVNNYIADLEDEITRRVDNEKGTLELNVVSSFEPKSDIGLAREHKVDLQKYKIVNYWTKKLPNGKFTSSLFCKLIDVDTDVVKQKEIILKELLKYTPNFKGEKKYKFNKSKNKMLELDLFDMHFGKLSHKEETGEDYDLKIAEARFKEAVQYFLSNAPLDEISTIVFPIGNDLINIDNLSSTTTAGTPQDCDSRFHKIIQVVKKVLIDTVTGLSSFAKVYIPIVPGNHDLQTTYMLGEMLSLYFHNHPNVTIDNGASIRKYFQFGECSFMYTHGDKENHKDLGNIFAAERSHLWGDTKYRYIKLGHLHKSKKVEFLTKDTFQGYQVEIIPSLSSSDFWHFGKGFIGNKQAKSFLYDQNTGEVANYTFTIPINL